MADKQPIITTAGRQQRRFAAFAVAVQAIVINQDDEILLLNSPKRKQGWQLVSGALEAEETLLAGTVREVREELGAEVRVRPLGTVHAQTFRYDENVSHMLAVYTLFAYQGGRIAPGDDMAGSEFRWWRVSELEGKEAVFHATVVPWMLRRAVEVSHLWREQPDMPLQPVL